MKLINIITILCSIFILTACEEDITPNDGAASTATIHFQGENCLSCHSDNSDNTSGVIFTIGGTLFDTINASDRSAGLSLNDYSLRLKDGSNIVNFIQGDGTGNFYSSATLTGDNYDFEIYNDSLSNPVNAVTGHGDSRKNCNTCHTASGNSGTKGRIVESVSFSKDLQPLCKSACTGCHSFSYSFASRGHIPLNPSTNGNPNALTQSINGHRDSTALSQSSIAYKTYYEWVREGANDN